QEDIFFKYKVLQKIRVFLFRKDLTLLPEKYISFSLSCEEISFFIEVKSDKQLPRFSCQTYF
ncbi:unnamed protein product, partial [Larinioides sclopetarius]